MRIQLWSYPAVAAVVTLAVLAAGAPAAGGGKGTTLRLGAIQKQQQFIDLAPTGPSLGDQLVFSDTVYRNGREFGTDGVSAASPRSFLRTQWRRTSAWRRSGYATG